MQRAVNFMPWLLLAFSSVTHAGLFRLESETLSSARNDADGVLEAPFYEFLSANYASLNRDLIVDMSLSVFADPIHRRNDFVFHLLNLSYKVVPSFMSLNLGRNFDADRAIRPKTLDTVGVDIELFDKAVSFGSFFGQERRLEYKQWQPTAIVFGGHLSYISPGRLPVLVRTKLQKRTFKFGDARSETLFEGSASKSFAGAWSPELLLDSEVNVVSKNLNRLSGGFNLYPDYRLAVRLRAESYLVREEDALEKPIFSIFSQGRLYEAALQAEYQLRSDLIGSVAAAYTNYVYQQPLRTDGARLELDLRYRHRLGSLGNSIYVLRSYGGEVYGDRLTLAQHLTDRLTLTEGLDIAYYRKITSSQRPALNSELELSFLATNRLTCTLGGEFNSNNQLRYDARVFFQLIYRLWAET